MLEFFKVKNKSFIGIDFATSSIKVVELSYKNQKVSLENYGIVDLNFGENEQKKIVENNSTYNQKINTALKNLVNKMELRHGAQAYVSIPGFSGIITIIELPVMKQDELARAIQFEAHKYIPSSLDEVVMSWEVVEQIGNVPSVELSKTEDNANKNIKNKVLLVAAPKKEIEYYDKLVSGVNFEVSAIELETFSIARSLVGDDNGVYFIIDIGSRSTNIILIEKSVVRVNRNINAGGNEITTTISDSMSISRQRSEIFKKGSKDLLNTKESSLTIPVLELIVSESKRILNLFMEKNKGVRIDGIFLSGGTSKMEGMEEYFTRCLGMSVKVGDPWRRISVSDEVAPLVKELGASFSVAIGLALRGVDEYRRK
ncbi:MAG: hypothetical protein ACD_8C00143G0011 [uncultured bacterium]|nr:MAG: hypothetical protein ACD_8C00143G0011 [uncultured bacterium]